MADGAAEPSTENRQPPSLRRSINHAIIHAELPDKISAGKCNGKDAKRQQLEALFSLWPQK
jgi:hypothetical protein